MISYDNARRLWNFMLSLDSLGTCPSCGATPVTGGRPVATRWGSFESRCMMHRPDCDLQWAERFFREEMERQPQFDELVEEEELAPASSHRCMICKRVIHGHVFSSENARVAHESCFRRHLRDLRNVET